MDEDFKSRNFLYNIRIVDHDENHGHVLWWRNHGGGLYKVFPEYASLCP